MSIKPPTLAQVRVSKVDKVPDGWFTRAQLEKEWDLSQAQTALLIKRAVESGKASARNFKISHTLRSYQSTPHYRFK
jgi:hypothetical protein